MMRAEGVAGGAEARVWPRRQPRDRGHDNPGLLRVVRSARAGAETGRAGGTDQLTEQVGVGSGSRLAARPPVHAGPLDVGGRRGDRAVGGTVGEEAVPWG